MYPGSDHKNTVTAAHNGAWSALTSLPIFKISVAAKINVKAAKPKPNGPDSSASM